jgi:hypothetical protein
MIMGKSYKFAILNYCASLMGLIDVDTFYIVGPTIN